MMAGKAKLDDERIELSVLRSTLSHDQQRALDVVAEIYGRDTVKLINGMMNMTVCAAILTGVSAEDFAAGMKFTWDRHADAINRAEN